MFGIHHNSCNFLDHFFVAGFVGSSPCVVNVSVLSRSVVSDSATSWIVAHLPPLSMGFSRQEYWSGLPFSSPGHLPNPGIEPKSPALQVDSLLTRIKGKPMPLNAAASAKSHQSCRTLCDPIDGSPLGSPIPGILQARTLEWVAISFSNA